MTTLAALEAGRHEGLRAAWAVARDDAFARGVGPEFDRINGEIEQLRDRFAGRDEVESRDAYFLELLRLRAERSALTPRETVCG